MALLAVLFLTEPLAFAGLHFCGRAAVGSWCGASLVVLGRPKVLGCAAHVDCRGRVPWVGELVNEEMEVCD